MEPVDQLNAPLSTQGLPIINSPSIDSAEITLYFYAIQSTEHRINKALQLLDPNNPELFKGEFAHWQGVVNELSKSLPDFSIATEAWKKPYSQKIYQPKVIVLLFSSKDLIGGDISSPQKKLLKIVRYFRRTCFSIMGNEELGSSFDYQPMIAVGLEDLMNLYSEDEKPSSFFRQLNLDHRIKYLDSSIWNRYIPLESEDQSAKFFIDRFVETANRMAQWHRDGLYNTVAAVTTLEFQTRMLYNSFIAKVNEKGHNELVRPFKFHSETQMRRKANKVMAFFNQDRNGISFSKTIKWNFLLVDDQAKHVPISSINQEYTASPAESSQTESLPVLSKSSLIQKILNADFPTDSIFLETPIQEHNIVGEMIDKLRPDNKIVFDVILLDYLLGHGKEREREYGHDFLLKLRQEPALQKGPYNRFWIFPISSFPHAFTDKLHQMGINHLTDWWHLSNGGDPVCTPELFRYNILDFLLQQISVCFYDEEMMIKNMKKFSYIKEFDTWLESIERIILHIQAYRDQMVRKSGSSFCTSFLAFLDNQKQLKTLEKEWLNLLEKCARETIMEDVLDLIEAFLQNDHEKYRIVFPPMLEEMLEKREKRYKVYIHYSGLGKDLFYLQLLEQSLKSVKSTKIEIWYPESSPLPGDELDESIINNIASSDFFMVLISADLLANEKKHLELTAIYKNKDKVITILCRNTIIEPKLQKQISVIVPHNKIPISNQIDKDEAMNAAVLLLLEKIKIST